MLQKWGKNWSGETYFVGDLHGSLSLLEQELERVGFDKEKDILFCSGDLIDRGERNFDTLKLLDEDWFVCCIGNHEQMMLDHFDGKTGDYYPTSYGEWLIREKYDKSELEHLVAKVRKLPVAIEIDTGDERIGIIHAEVPDMDWNTVAEISTESTNEYFTSSLNHYNVAIWSRTIIKSQTRMDVSNIDIVVHGHTPVRHATSLGNRVYIDVGTVYTGNCKVFSLNEIREMAYNS